ncbi:MAG: methionine aminotransferase [Crocinitomicaceae bacterium]|nr:methionine aminotransferase [Crocinitomicaceae bacterium]
MSKLPNVGTTIFSTMSKLAADHNAINLSQGFPNFPVEASLIQLLKDKADENVHQYMPMPGSPALLQQLAATVEKTYQRAVNPSEEILVVAGATQGLFTTIMALVEAGDEVVILDPSYDCYEPAIILAGGIPKRIGLNNAFLPDWNLINKTVSSKTKMIITNNPHNPSGRIWNTSDMEELEQLVQKHKQLLVLSDEVYEFITFNRKHLSLNSSDILKDRSIIISSFGKTFHITGWKMGYAIAPKELMVEIKKVHQFNVFSVNSVSQAVLTAHLQQTDLSVLGDFYKEKRDLFRKLMESSRFELLPCDGTYFQTANYSAISSENDVAFCERLTIEHGVAAIPISVFNADGRDDKIIRFCFAKDDATLIAATEKLCKI